MKVEPQCLPSPLDPCQRISSIDVLTRIGKVYTEENSHFHFHTCTNPVTRPSLSKVDIIDLLAASPFELCVSKTI